MNNSKVICDFCFCSGGLTYISAARLMGGINSDTGALNPEPLENESVIVCSCAVISDRDIDRAVIEIMSVQPALLPTPGVVFRHLQKRMNCCRCAPLAVAVIYQCMDRLQKDTRVCPYALAEARRKLAILDERRQRRDRAASQVVAVRSTTARVA